MPPLIGEFSERGKPLFLTCSNLNHLIEIGKGQKQRAKTSSVTIAITVRFVPKGSMTPGGGCGTFIMIPNKTA